MIIFQLFDLLFVFLANLGNLLHEVVYDRGLGRLLKVKIGNLAFNISVNVFNQVDKSVFMQTLIVFWCI